MRTRDEVIDNFTYHAPTSAQQATLGVLGEGFRELALLVFDNLPESADRTIALRKIADARMATNLALILTAK
jgi:hypothetical protein